MKNTPHRIYLQFGDDIEKDDDFNELVSSGEVTWCTEKINDSDICYIRAGKKNGAETAIT